MNDLLQAGAWAIYSGGLETTGHIQPSTEAGSISMGDKLHIVCENDHSQKNGHGYDPTEGSAISG